MWSDCKKIEKLHACIKGLVIFFIIKSSVLKTLMRGSCHFGNSSNFEISVECRNICLFSAGSKRTNYTAFF